jgi:hypothetical protein
MWLFVVRFVILLILVCLSKEFENFSFSAIFLFTFDWPGPARLLKRFELHLRLIEIFISHLISITLTTDSVEVSSFQDTVHLGVISERLFGDGEALDWHRSFITVTLVKAFKFSREVHKFKI